MIEINDFVKVNGAGGDFYGVVTNINEDTYTIDNNAVAHKKDCSFFKNDDIKRIIFDEPKIFEVKCIVKYFGEDWSDYDYPEYTIKAYSWDDVFDKIQDEISDYVDDYSDDYHSSDWEVLEFSIILDENFVEFDLTKEAK